MCVPFRGLRLLAIGILFSPPKLVDTYRAPSPPPKGSPSTRHGHPIRGGTRSFPEPLQHLLQEMSRDGHPRPTCIAERGRVIADLYKKHSRFVQCLRRLWGRYFLSLAQSNKQRKEGETHVYKQQQMQLFFLLRRGVHLRVPGVPMRRGVQLLALHLPGPLMQTRRRRRPNERGAKTPIPKTPDPKPHESCLLPPLWRARRPCPT